MRTSPAVKATLAASLEAGVLGGGRDRLVLQLEAVDQAGAACEQKAHGADAAVQVVGGPPGRGPGGPQRGLVEHTAHLGVGLQKGERRHAQPQAGELFVKVGGPRDHERADAHRGVGAALVHGHGEGAVGLLGGDQIGKLTFGAEALRDEEIEQQLAARPALPHD